MVETLRSFGIAFIVFSLLISLFAIGHIGLKNTYGVTDTYTVDGKNVGQSFSDLSIIKQLNKSMTEPNDIDLPSGSFFDVGGTLMAAGIGALKTIGAILALPVEIVAVITNFYYIPPVFISAIITIIILIVGFILLSKYIGSDI